jgi:heme/copper-type cytochrome/quinol oxidase subunit 1
MADVTAPEQPAPRPVRPRGAAVVLVALVVLGVGLLLAALWVASRPTSFGWFAYAPVSGTTFVPVGAYPPGAAALLAGAGALLVGGAVGFVLGRRRGAPAQQSSAPSPAPSDGPGPGSGPGSAPSDGGTAPTA